jgi:beta-galactosidase
MAIVQSTKSAGEITVEATSPGLTPVSVRVLSKPVKLRPQVAVWDREAPSGEGVTGLWRPVTGGIEIFTLRQNGSSLMGTVQGAAGPGGGAAVEIEDGKVDNGAISFRAGNTTYTGTVKGDRIELQPAFTGRGGRGGPVVAQSPAGPRPAIGPPPDGSDPSRPQFVGLGGGRGPQGPATVALKRVTR